MDVGEYIKQLRLSRGLSQEELGKIAGVQRAAVQKWEAGKVQNLKRDTIKILADYFDVNPAKFIDIDSDELNDDEENQLNKEILEIFNRISDDKKREALKYIKYIESQND